MKRSSVIPKPVTEYDLRLLRIFRSVVECGGFAAAESVLNITRSTISVHISSLESRMGLKLCLRGRAGFSLTPEGQEVYHACLNLFDSLSEFGLLVSSLGKELGGELVILCADQLTGDTQGLLAQVVAGIHQSAPNLHLVLDTEGLAEIEKALLDDKAHVGLLPPYHRIDGLTYTPLSEEPIYLCCSRAHALYQVVDEQITPDSLKQQATVHPGIDIDPAGREQLQQLSLTARAYQFDTRKTLIMSGCYIGYMPMSQIGQEIDSGDIRLIRPDLYQYTFALSLVTRSRPKEPAKVEMAKEQFRKIFQY